MTMGNCVICKNQCNTDRKAISGVTRYECKHCDTYLVATFFNKSSALIQSAMYFNQLQRDNDDKPNYYISRLPDEQDETVRYVTQKEVENLIPKNFLERVEKVLLNLSIMYDGFGKLINASVNREILSLACFLDSSSPNVDVEINGFLESMGELGYLAKVDNYNFKITAKGWLDIQRLNTVNAALPQAFIAMWFDPKMSAARAKIISAIEDCGYKAVIIDYKEHNNQIVPEIFYEIKRSKFIIADLTRHRNGVYYEAGYAEALGKEVILTCEKEETDDKPHFDVQQKNTIFWTDEDDLYDRLVKRIEATIGKI